MITPTEIKQAVSRATGVSVLSIEGTRRDEITARARHAVMFFMRNHIYEAGQPMSYSRIATEFRGGNLNHGTVMHGVKRHADRISVDKHFKSQSDEVRSYVIHKTMEEQQLTEKELYEWL